MRIKFDFGKKRVHPSVVTEVLHRLHSLPGVGTDNMDIYLRFHNADFQNVDLAYRTSDGKSHSIMLLVTPTPIEAESENIVRHEHWEPSSHRQKGFEVYWVSLGGT